MRGGEGKTTKNKRKERVGEGTAHGEEAAIAKTLKGAVEGT